MAIVFDESTAKALQWLMQIQKDQGEDGIKRLMSGIGSLKSLNSSSIATSEKSSFTGREQSPPTPVESVQGNRETKVQLTLNTFLISRRSLRVVFGIISVGLVMRTFLIVLVKRERGRKRRKRKTTKKTTKNKRKATKNKTRTKKNELISLLVEKANPSLALALLKMV